MAPLPAGWNHLLVDVLQVGDRPLVGRPGVAPCPSATTGRFTAMVDLAHGRLGGGAMRSSPESSPSVLRRACARRAAECSRACFIAGVVQLQQWFSGFSGACGWLWAATIAWRGSDGGGVQWRRLRGATLHLFDFFFLSLSLRRTTWHFHELHVRLVALGSSTSRRKLSSPERGLASGVSRIEIGLYSDERRHG